MTIPESCVYFNQISQTKASKLIKESDSVNWDNIRNSSEGKAQERKKNKINERLLLSKLDLDKYKIRDKTKID
jgi:hypothetical protein